MITLDIATFRTLFPEFASATTYPDVLITQNWDIATVYVSNEDYGWMATAQRTRALNLLTAHVTSISTMISNGEDPQIVTSSSIDKISVTAQPPIIQNQFHYWLALTPYGKELLALLKMASVCGMYVGGRAERAAFRKVGGSF